MEYEKDYFRDGLSASPKGRSFMVDNIDSFVARILRSVQEVKLYPFHNDAGNYEFWDKVGAIVGNLMEL
jgi:hypothetical protein